MPDALPIVLQQIDLDIVPGKIPPIVHVSEYDTGRNIVVNLFRDGYPFGSNSIESYTVKVEGSIGKYGFSENAAWADDAEGVVIVHLTEAMTAIHGRVWTKIKLIKSESMQISTCGFWLDVDRAGVNAQDVIQAQGFQEQINAGVNAYLDSHQPFFELPSGGQLGQALLSDGDEGAYWGQAQGGGSGLTEDIKQALLDCFENVAWINAQGQTYYDALYDALYPPAPPANLVSISAVFNQGSAVVYDTDSLDVLKQYLTVTGRFDDGTVQTVSNYVLSGRLSEGSSAITVSYGGKTAAFNVTVTHDTKPNYNLDALDGVNWIDDYKYNTSTGVLEPFTGEHVTEKFTAQDCLYRYQAGSEDSYTGVYVWTESGAFLRFDQTQGNAMNQNGCYQFKPGYQYAMKVFNESSFDSSAVSMMPVNNSLSGVQQFSMRLKDFKDSFTKTKAGIEFDATSFFNSNGVYTPLMEINRISEPGGLQITMYMLDVLTVSVYTNRNNSIVVILNAPNISTAAEMQAYIEANDPIVIFNY